MKVLMIAVALLGFGQTSTPDTPPIGLWQNNEEGMVVCIETCGNGFCGVTAGVAENSHQKREEVCGKTMLKDFVWDSSKSAWQGHMQPPDMNRTLDAEVKTDGSSYLTLHVHMMMMSKTMQFVPFKGQVTSACEIS